MTRLTKGVRQLLLENNEGFTTRTNYVGRNSREERIYRIQDGNLFIRAIGKTSWADSHYDDEWMASDEEIHRFLYKFQDELQGLPETKIHSFPKTVIPETMEIDPLPIIEPIAAASPVNSEVLPDLPQGKADIVQPEIVAKDGVNGWAVAGIVAGAVVAAGAAAYGIYRFHNWRKKRKKRMQAQSS